MGGFRQKWQLFKDVIRNTVLILLYCVSIGFARCLDKALVAEILEKSKDISDPEKRIAVLMNLHNKCISCSLGQDTIYALIDFRLSRLYDLKKRDFAKAIQYMNMAVKSLEKCPLPSTSPSLIDAYYFLGQYHFYTDEKEKAILYLDKAVEQCDKQSYRFYIASVSYKNQAEIFLSLGDYYKSIEKAELGIKYGKKAKESRFTAQNKWIQALSFFELKKYDNADAKISEAIKIAENTSLDDYDLGSYYSFKGAVLRKKGDFKSAFKSYLDAEKVLLYHGYMPDVGQIYDDIGVMFLEANDYKNALKYFLGASKFVNEKLDKITVTTNIGKVYAAQGQFSQAEKYYRTAVEYAGDTKKSYFKDNIYDLYASIAKLYFNQAIYVNHTKIKKQFFRKSLSYHLLADQLIDFMRWEHSGNQSKLFWRNKTRSIYENAIETCYLLKDYEKAFYFFEKSRAVLLNDKLNELGAKQALSEADRAKEIQLQSRIDELRKKSETDKNKIEQTERELLMAENAQNDFIKNLEKTNPAYYNFKYNTKTDSIKQVQRYLKSKGSTLVEYFVGDSATYTIVISPTAVKIQTLLFDPNDTQTYLRLCAKDISTKTELNEFLAVSNRLYRNLIAPLNLSKGHLIISQDGAFLPFEALSLSTSKPGSYLLNEQAISYTYSAQFLLKNQPSFHFWPQRSFLGVAPVQFSQNLNTLTGSAESIGRIGGTYLWKNELVHQKATKSAFLNQASGHRIVQVYTHAFADSTQTEPHIYFADSALKVSDLGNASFKINLLVLSACKTGVGKLAKGEGILSLARGFSMAGIPSTITTLWSVEDQTTYALTELFYTFLNEGLSKDEALQKAKRQYISMHPNAAPAAWAGLVLIGDAAALPSNTLWWWGLGGLAVLLIIGGVFMKRSFL